MKRLIPVWCLVLASAGTQCPAAEIDLDALAARSQVRYTHVPRKVLAFYYPWYGNPNSPDGSGTWSHWNGVDPQARQIASSTHFPRLGPYDSHDPKLIAQHTRWAKSAGVDGFIISWWGKGSFEDRAMERLLDGCRQTGLQATVYYERVPDPQTPRSAADDIIGVLQRYAEHPAWLRVHGRPVIFIYGRAVGQLGLAGWLTAIAMVNDRYPGGAFFVGDRTDPIAACVFDGIHTYNTAAKLRGRSPGQVKSWANAAYRQWVAAADAFGRISAITVIPGYDDTKIRRPGLRVERRDGALYRAQWEAAIGADPHWILITSWNEWHEGSEIEPSVEYGDAYLKRTAELAARFKALGARCRPQPNGAASGISADEKAAMRKRLAGIPMALMPDADLAVVWRLWNMGLRPVRLSWDQVAGLQRKAADKLPVLIYASGERYRQSVHGAGDVDGAIQRYLRGGGCLVVLPAGPTPFYYNEKGEAVNRCPVFGLPIAVGGDRGGWERPPLGRELFFVQSRRGRLAHLPERFPFPETGDLRWRPLVRQHVAEGGQVEPLLELRDKSDRSYGDAVAWVHYRSGRLEGGKLAYVWFGLLQSPLADRLLYDLFFALRDHIE